VTLAQRFHWTEQQVDALDPELVEELLSYCQAEGDHREYLAREAERKRS